MKKCYLVNYSHGDYEDFRSGYLTTVFLSFDAAEKAKEEFELSQRTETPFPTNKFTYADWNSSADRVFIDGSEEDYKLVNEWEDEKNWKESFNKARVTELILEDE
jgi:hypothetical protein